MGALNTYKKIRQVFQVLKIIVKTALCRSVHQNIVIFSPYDRSHRYDLRPEATNLYETTVDFMLSNGVWRDLVELNEISDAKIPAKVFI